MNATPHIRLNMIVKNEAAVIQRCLASVKPWIHSWVIVDTGSTDGTQEIIRDFMQDISGELIERPWKNFGYNRTEALQLAQAEHLEHADDLLFIDADETLEIQQGFQWEGLDQSAYYFTCKYAGMHYQRNAMISTKLNWHWKGVLHEYLTSEQAHRWHVLDDASIIVAHDGSRGKTSDTYLRDIHILKQGLIDEPENKRYMFYLAQSYRDAKLFGQSREAYLKRADANGWEEERWMAQLYATKMAVLLNYQSEEIYTEFLQCWIQRQHRAEPLYELAVYYRLRKQFDLASYYAKQAVEIPYPTQDILFIDQEVYQWRALDELSISASYCPSYKPEGKKAIERLIAEEKFPENERARILDNYRWYR